MVKYIDPTVDGVHPHRLKMSDADITDVLEGLENGDDWMSQDELDAVLDYLHDFIVSKKQNVEGVTTLQ